jgi:predicted transcriptional regulator
MRPMRYALPGRRAIFAPMSKTLKDVLERAAGWPEWAQRDLAELANEIDREVNAGTYHATREELRKIDEGLAAARRGEIATDEEVEAVFTKYRR